MSLAHPALLIGSEEREACAKGRAELARIAEKGPVLYQLEVYLFRRDLDYLRPPRKTVQVGEEVRLSTTDPRFDGTVFTKSLYSPWLLDLGEGT